MKQTWAVARQMIAEGVRMKIALVFLVLLGTVVLALPTSISGDSSVTGAVQSFLSYGLSATALILGMLTIFLSRSLSDEFVNRNIFLTLTKPISRWRFVLGKWLGITILNAVFLTFACAAIYGMVHYIIRTHPPIDTRFDAKELKDEVLVARHAIKMTIPDFTKAARAEFQKNREDGRYVNVSDLDPKKETDRLAKKYEARWRVVGPLGSRVFRFQNVLCDRSPDKTIQLRYRTEVSGYAPDEIFRAWWRFGDPSKGTHVYDRPVRHVIGRTHTIRVPANCVAPDNTLTVRFVNENPFPGERQYNNVIEFRKSGEVAVLFRVGSFEGNFFRLGLLMISKLMFLAAVALLMTTVFSFPVACLTSFTVYVLAGARSFLSDALDWSAGGHDTSMFDSLKEFIVQSVAYLYGMAQWVLPDFGRFDGVETFVNGHNVSLVWVLQAVSEVALFKTAIVLGLATLLFHRRELAEISV